MLVIFRVTLVLDRAIVEPMGQQNKPAASPEQHDENAEHYNQVADQVQQSQVHNDIADKLVADEVDDLHRCHKDKYESNHVGPVSLKLERSALLDGSAQHDDCVHVESEAGESYGEVDDVCARHDLLKVSIVARYEC